MNNKQEIEDKKSSQSDLKIEPDETVYYSHPDHQQDRWVINSVFAGKRNGWFVEAGAGGQSNTRTLEKYYGWTGLGVEPEPERFREISEYRACHLENVCLTSEPGEVAFTINLSAPGTSAVKDTLSNSLRNQFYSDDNTRDITVTGVPLCDLLDKYEAPPMIDYLSLDVEGGEWDVLREFPFDRYGFRCMTIERGSDDYRLLRRKLLSLKYRLVRTQGPDDFWVHPTMTYRSSLTEWLGCRIRQFKQSIKRNATRL